MQNVSKIAPWVPGGSRLLGSSAQFQKDPLGFVAGTADQYGSIVHYRLGNVHCYGVHHPEGVQRVLLDNHHNYIKGEFFKTLRIAVGDGLLTSEGETWLRQRRLMSPVFHRQRIASFARIMVEQTQVTLDSWEAAAGSGKPIDLAQELTGLTMRIITLAMFSAQVESQDGAISKAIANMLEDVQYRFIVPFYPGLWAPTPRNLKARRDLGIIDEMVYGIIRARRRSGIEADDLLGLLMSARDQDTSLPMNDQQLRDEVITIFVAGHETTAAALTWLFYLLDQNPQAAQAVYDEVAIALDGRAAGMDDLAGLVCTRRAIDEALRLYPPAWITNRTALQDDELCGYAVPAGAVVIISPYVTHRLAEFWPEPEVFNPDRFTTESSAGRPRFAYLPFGGGPHQCIGNQFALVEAVLITATIAQKFRLQLAPGEQAVPQPAITLRPKNGLNMYLDKAND